MICEVGLPLHSLYLFLGATPDGLVNCSFDGILDIKSTYLWI